MKTLFVKIPEAWVDALDLVKNLQSLSTRSEALRSIIREAIQEGSDRLDRADSGRPSCSIMAGHIAGLKIKRGRE